MKEYISLEKFSNRLSIVMEENNDTTYSLGEYLHLQAPTISRYANGLMEPKMTTIEAIARKYSLNVAWLLGADVPKYLEKEVFQKKIPVLGVIAAGQPIYATEDIMGYEYIDNDTKLDFCLKVRGDSMIGARIYNDDVVFVQKQDIVDNGEIAVIIIDGQEATLKRFFKNTNSIVLHSENPTIPDMVYTGKERKLIKVIGKVKYVKFEAR